MMKFIIFTVLFCIFLFPNVNGQNLLEDFDQRSSIRWGVNLSVNYNIDTHQRVGVIIITDSQLNYDFGISFEKQFGKRFSILSSLGYANRDFTGYSLEDTDFPICNVCLSVIRTIDPAIIQDFKLRYAEIPVLARYYAIKRKFVLYVEGGVNNYVTLKKDLSERTSYVAALLGLGFGYEITNRIRIDVSAIIENDVTKVYRGDSRVYREPVDFDLRVSKSF